MPRTARLTPAQFMRVSRALADPRRVRILRQLGRCTDAACCADLQKAHRVTPPTLSHHLKELETAGLITIAREGRFARITLRRPVLDAYLARLAEI